MTPMDFWGNSSPFFGAAAFCMTKIDDFRKENLKNENSKKEDEPKKEDESKYEDEPKETNKNVESTCLFQLAFE